MVRVGSGTQPLKSRAEAEARSVRLKHMSPHHQSKKLLVWSDDIVVASHRHQGIGRRLLVDLIEASVAHGCRAVSLSVAEDNPARGLYESAGFVPVEKRERSWTMIRHAAQSD